MKLRAKHRKMFSAYVFLSPAILVLLGVVLYPATLAVWVSFVHIDFTNLANIPFVGLRNYQDVFGSSYFLDVMLHTLKFTAISVSIAIVSGLALALILNAKSLKLKRTFRVLVLLPWALTPVVVGLIWRLMLDARFGLINWALLRLGLISSRFDFLGDYNIVLYSLILPVLWTGVCFSSITLLGGLQEVPEVLYEAAVVDGASSWQRFWRITLPCMKI